jgi:hypothetical protein
MLKSPPILTTLTHEEPILLYTTATTQVVSAMLVVEREEPGRSLKVQHLLTVNSCIKVCLDLQADKSPVVVKGPFFPRVVNPRYRIRAMCNVRIQSSKAR